jgi:hypothetical protein
MDSSSSTAVELRKRPFGVILILVEVKFQDKVDDKDYDQIKSC